MTSVLKKFYGAQDTGGIYPDLSGAEIKERV